MASVSPESAWEFAEAIKSVVGKPTTKRRATVQSVDKDGTIWVQLPGSANTTPIASTGANVSPGDTVLTELRGTQLHITENNTDPAIGTRQAGDIARQAAKPAVDAAKAAEGIAGEAKSIASATGQHFWDDDNGAHVTDVTQAEWKDAAADDFSDLSDAKPYHNLLMNSLGILLRRALNNLVSISRSAIAFYDGLGNNAANILASFGVDGATIGREDEARLELSDSSLNYTGANSEPLVAIQINPDTAQYWTYEFTAASDQHNFIAPEAEQMTISGTQADISGYSVLVNGAELYDDGNNVALQTQTDSTLGTVTVRGVYFTTPPAEGSSVVVRVAAHCHPSLLVGAHNIKPIGAGSIAAGGMSSAQGDASIAVGKRAGAFGECSAAFGYSSNARGQYAMSAGYDVASMGFASMALGNRVRADGDCQAVFGSYNEYDTNGDYLLIVGNGTGGAHRSNAHTLDWQGNAVYAGDVTDGTGNVLSDKLDASTAASTYLPKTALTVDTYTQAYTAAANSLSGEITIDVSKTGYTPLGIVGFACGAGGAAIEQASISGTTATLYIRNVTSSAISRDCTINVLYVAVV